MEDKQIKGKRRTKIRDTKIDKIFRSENPLEGLGISAGITPKPILDNTTYEK
jgi:hypothetical protein